MKFIKYCLFVFLLLLLSIYYFHIYKSKNDFYLVAEKFYQSCKTNQYCDDKPEGWEYNSKNKFIGNKLMIYTVSSDRKNFTLEQKVAVSVTFVAYGGVDTEVVVKKLID